MSRPIIPVKAEAMPSLLSAYLAREIDMFDGHIIRDVAVDGEPSLDVIKTSVPIGPAEVVAERLVREIRQNGISDLSCFMMPAGIEPKAALRSMERFGRDVMPMVARELANDGREAAKEVA